MELTDKQFLNLLKDLIKEVVDKREVLLETPKKKKPLLEKKKDSGKIR
jgi:hypothetical protein